VAPSAVPSFPLRTGVFSAVRSFDCFSPWPFRDPEETADFFSSQLMACSRLPISEKGITFFFT